MNSKKQISISEAAFLTDAACVLLGARLAAAAGGSATGFFAGATRRNSRCVHLRKSAQLAGAMPLTGMPSDALGHVLGKLTLAHEIVATAPTCRLVSVAAKLAIKARRFAATLFLIGSLMLVGLSSWARQQRLEELEQLEPPADAGEVVRTIITPGDMQTYPKPGDKLKMHYTGTLAADGDRQTDRHTQMHKHTRTPTHARTRAHPVIFVAASSSRCRHEV